MPPTSVQATHLVGLCGEEGRGRQRYTEVMVHESMAKSVMPCILTTSVIHKQGDGIVTDHQALTDTAFMRAVVKRHLLAVRELLEHKPQIEMKYEDERRSR